MRLDVKALGLTFALLGGGAVLVVGLANLIWPGYGAAFLQVAASVYPGYAATSSIGQVIIGTVYSLVDCFVCGVILGWLYNTFLSAPTGASR